MEYLVGRQDEIGERGCKLVQAGDVEVGVFRIHGKLHAYVNQCVHQGGPVCQGEVLGKLEEVLAPDRTVIGERFSEQEIHVCCPWHGWEYDLETGACAADPRLHLRAFPVVERAGEVFVDV